jgi:hypothetical protein
MTLPRVTAIRRFPAWIVCICIAGDLYPASHWRASRISGVPLFELDKLSVHLAGIYLPLASRYDACHATGRSCRPRKPIATL